MRFEAPYLFFVGRIDKYEADHFGRMLADVASSIDTADGVTHQNVRRGNPSMSRQRVQIIGYLRDRLPERNVNVTAAHPFTVVTADSAKSRDAKLHFVPNS